MKTRDSFGSSVLLAAAFAVPRVLSRDSTSGQSPPTTGLLRLLAPQGRALRTHPPNSVQGRLLRHRKDRGSAEVEGLADELRRRKLVSQNVKGNIFCFTLLFAPLIFQDEDGRVRSVFAKSLPALCSNLFYPQDDSNGNYGDPVIETAYEMAKDLLDPILWDGQEQKRLNRSILFQGMWDFLMI